MEPLFRKSASARNSQSSAGRADIRGVSRSRARRAPRNAVRPESVVHSDQLHQHGARSHYVRERNHCRYAVQPLEALAHPFVGGGIDGRHQQLA